QGRLGGLTYLEVGWDFQRALLAHLETVWQSPDEGIWEVRGGRPHFTYSKGMAWGAVDRAIKNGEAFGPQGPARPGRGLRDQICEEVCAKAFDPGLGAFVQAYGSHQLDASTLLIPTVGFLPPDDPRVIGTIAAVERGLMRDGLVLRYDSETTKDGLPPGEGA